MSPRHESAASKRAGHRGTLSCRRACVCLLFATILFFWNALAAHAQYVQRQVVTTNGAITFVGNSLGLNKDGTNDRPGTSGSVGAFITTDTSVQKNPEWPQGTTGDWRLNSSSAVVSLLSGSRVIHAELIWGGSYLFGTEDVSDFLNDPINFTTPAGTTQVAHDPATAVTRSGPQKNYYVRTANVTSLVSAAGNGTYTVGRVPATQATDEANFNAAGWTLAIVYENSSLPARSLSLFLGLEPQGGATASVAGICTPDNNGKLRARVAVSASGGDTPDPGNTRDSLRFGPSSNLSQDNFRLSGPNNPAENFFASQINRDDGELDTRGTFGDRNNDFKGTFAGGREGWDITNVDASPELAIQQTAAFAQGTADADDYFINALAMQIDVVAPAFSADGATSVSSSTAQVGDVLTYTVELDNRSGAADANDVVLTVPLPAGMSFVAGSFRLDGTATGANPITGAAIGTVAQKTRREATFQLRVDSIPGAPAPARYQVTPTWTYTFVGCSGQTPQPGSSTSNTMTTEIARITAAKSASAPSIRPEETLTYTIVTLNSGTAASHDTLVTDAIPTGTTYRPNTTTLNGVAIADQLGTSPLVVGMLVNSSAVALAGKPPTPGVIEPGQSAIVSFQVIVNSSTTDRIVNTAMVEPDGINGPLPPVPALVTTPVNLSSADVRVSMAGPVTATAGTNIIHTITVLNDGPSAATSVSLFDDDPPGLTRVSVTGACSALPCSLGSMANDETRTVSVTYAIPVNYSGADPIVNRASVTTASEDIFPNNNSASVSTALRASVADLMITNTNGVEGVVVGTPTIYTITVTNAGPATAADAVVTDIFPSVLTGVSWSCAGTGGAVCGAAAGTGNINATVTVPVAGAATFTATGTVDSATSNTIENTARVVPAAGTSDPTQAIATDIDPIELRADLSVTETGPATVVAGNQITYTLTVHNAGPSADENVLLEELVPLELTFVSATGPCTAFPCSLATLAAGATVSLEVTYAVPEIYLPDTVVSAGRVSSSTVDPNESNNISTTTATVDRNADVEIIKQISPDTTSLLGEDATFFVTVTNHGPAPATGVVVMDLLPAGLTLVSAHVSQGSYVPQAGQWVVGTLEDEAFATLTLISTLTVVDTITNSAQVLRQNEPDPVSSNNFSAAVLNGQENADVGVDIAVDKPAPLVGENVTFTVTVANRGPSPANGLVVTDLLSAGLTLVSAVPSQGTFVAPDWTIGTLSEIALPVTLTIVANVTATGPQFSAATIRQQTEADSNPANNRASVTLNAAESANLKVTKSLTRSSPHVGELLTFNVSVANQGPSPATGVAVTEVLSAGLAYESAAASQGAYDRATGIWTVGSIGNAGSAALSITARVTQSGTVTNTASVTASDQPDPDLTDNTSSVTLTTETIADLAVTQTLTGSPVPGRSITNTIVVTNNGPSPVTAATVSDLFPVALVAPLWTCTADPGSSCAAASGTGNLATTVSLESGDRATFLVSGLIAANATGSLNNTATVAAPAGAVDPDPANNTTSISVLLTPVATLEITKAGPANAVAGTNIVYTITVTNAGPSDATGVTLADPTPPGLTFVANAGDCTTAFPCALGTLPPGATSTITATFAVPSGYTTPNPIANTATVSSVTPPAISTSATTNTPLAPPVTDLHITKTNGVDSVVAGRPTTYTITVTNPLGPSDASGATVTDTFPATLTGVTWTCTGTAGGACPTSGSGNINTPVTVPVGASVVFTASGTVNPAATGDLVNSAQVLPPTGLANRTSAIATDHDAIDTEADVAITKIGPVSIVAGNPLVYTITVTNTGPSDAANVVVRDPTPPGLTWVSTTGACTTAFPCALGVVPAGATRTITASFSVPLDYSGASPIANVTDASSTTVDTNAANNTATVETTLNRNADVAIVKQVSPAAVLVGQPTTFTAVVTNHGPARVTGLVVQDLLPAGLSFVSASHSQGSYAEATGAWTIGTLLNAQSATLTLAATVTVAGALTNRALIVAQDQPDPVASNNSAAAIVNGAANADVGVTKIADRTAPLVGETVTFTVTVVNTGPSPATSVVVTDTLPPGLTFVDATASQGIYTAPAWTVGTLGETGTPATLTIVATVTAPGALVNTATITQQTEVDANPANNHASVTLNAAESANLTVIKSLTRSSPHVGELLTFNVSVTNQGPSPATGIQVTEVLSAGLAYEAAAASQGAYDPTTGVWTVGSIANAGSAGLTITARVTQAGTVTNTASVTASDQPDPDLADNTASVTLTTETIADLAITKSLTGPAIPGLATTYTIVVTNLGPSPVTAASVSDLFPVALVAPAWTCTADPGSSCAAPSGTGNLATTVTLEAGDRASFTITGVIASNAVGLLVNTATVAAPAGALDPDLANNTATSSVALTPSADLQITKAGPANAVAGTNVVYTITVTNAGPSEAAVVTLTDPTPSGLTFVANAGDCTTAFPCDLGTLPPAATRTITATFSVPSGYTTPDPIANTSTVSSTTPDSATGNNSATTTTSLAAAVTDLHITKTNGVNGVVAGLPTTYTLTITNPLGPSDANGATITDTFPATLTGVTWTCAGTGGGACPTSGSGNINTPVTVPVGGSVVFTATGTVDPAATGELVNSAQVLPPTGLANRTSAIATDSDPVTARADVAITKTGPVSIVAGNPIVYTITVTNTGPSDAAGVVVSDVTPPGLVFVSTTGACTTAFPCALGVVPAGTTRTITATFMVPITYPGLGPIVNLTDVSSTTVDTSATNNTATVETTLNRNADVAMSKSVSPAAVLVGQPTTFTVVVTNHGPARVTGLVVQDLLPAGLSFVSASHSQGSYAEATGAWTIATLLNGQSATLTLAATVTVAGAITNRALIVAQDQPDPVASNNSAAAIVNGAANADVGVIKIADTPTPLVGTNVTFTVTVVNAGPSPATEVVVTDALPAGLTLVSATESQGTYTAPTWTVGTLSETGTPATLTIVATVTAPGAMVNTATITQQAEVDANLANNRASVTLNAAESANLTVTKSLTRASPHVGELLTFNVSVANQGPSSATGVAVTEVLSAGLAYEAAAASQGGYDPTTGVWTVGSIANAGSAGLTITARVTQAGTVTNTASVTASDQPDPDPTDNTASVTLTTETIADLAVTKTLTGSAVPGRATTYSIVVTNAGPSPVTAASVTDVFPVALVAPAWTCAADPGSSCAAASGTGNLATTVTLEAGDRATFVVTGLIAASATGLLVNTATVTALTGALDPDLANNATTSSVTLTPSADLHIAKDGPLNAVAGTNVIYTITVMNAGPSDATGVTLADPTPPGLTSVSNAGDCTTAFPCDLGTMPRASTRTVTATFAIPAGYTTPNPIANTATVSSLTPPAVSTSATTNTPVGAPVTDLHITNTNGVNGVVAGLPTTYTLTITNPLGPSDANGATITDTFPATLTGVTWTCAGSGGGTCVAAGSGDLNTPVTVPVGASVVFTATGTVDPAATGELVNSAQVLPPTGLANRTSAIATDRDAISTVADVAITKTVDQASIVAGNPLVYTITVTNTGPSDAANVVVRDPTPPGLTWVSTTGACTTPFPCTLGVLPASGTQIITATFTVPPAYSGPSPIENVTDVSSTTVDTNTTNNAATAVTTLNRNADVEVTKTVPSSGVLVGDEILVTINALNHGPNPATDIEITDSLPAGFDFVSASASQGAYDPATGAWSVGSLAVSETAQLVLTAKVTAPGVITNLAVKTGQNEPDPIVGNDSSAAGTTATPAADLEVDKEVDRHNALVGERLTFTVRATNRGPSPATGVTIADALPAGLSLVSAAFSQGSYDSATGLWTVGALDWLAQATLTLVARVDQPGALVNNASMASQDQIDPNPINNSDAASVNAAPAADLRVIKAVSDAAPGVGALVTYTIAVTNLGPNDATSADVSDVLPAGVAFVSARASQGSYDAGTGVWTLGAVPATRTEILRVTGRVTELGTLVNTATRQSSTPVDPNAANDTGTATLTSSIVADLTLTKTPSVPVAAAGAAFTWTVAVVNNGPSTAVGASVTDAFPAPFTGVTWTCTPSSGSRCTSLSGTGTIATTVDLLAGGSATFVATGLSAPVGSSPLVNAATVTVAPGTTDPDLSDNSDTSAVGLVPLADVQVTQAGPSVLAPGTSGDYLITIANVGPSRTASTSLLMPTPGGVAPITVRGACSSLPCALGELAPGELREVIATLSPPADYAGPPTLIVQSLAVSAPFDPRPENNAASVVTTITQVADLSITKTGPTTAVPGTRVTYALTVANTGPSVATGVRVDDPTPAGLTLVSTSGDCTTAFPCDLGTMAPGTTRTIAATYTVAGGTAAPPEITNTATVVSGISDANAANNTATISTRIRISTKCDVDGDGLDEIVTGAGPGGGPHVLVWSLAGGVATPLASFYAYDPLFGGGVNVACGDLDGDGLADVVTAAGPGGGSHVRGFSFAGGGIREIASFSAYDQTFGGDVRVAVADVNGDGMADIITGAGPSGGPHVRAFSLAGGGVTEVASFYAYDPSFTGGVYVAGGDVNGDGIAEIITGTTRAGGPVRVFTIGGPGRVAEFASFFAYIPAFEGAVRVAAADVNGDGLADIITGAGPGGGPHVVVWDLGGGGLTMLASFYAYDPAFCDIGTTTPDPTVCDGVYVAAGDVTGDGLAEVITGTNRVGGPVRVFQIGAGVIELTSFHPYFEAFRGPVRVAAVDLNRIVPAVLPGFLSRLANRADDLIPPREEVGAGAEVGRMVKSAEKTTIVTLFRPPVARDVPLSAGRALLARVGWLQSTVEQRLHRARRARAPPYAGTALSIEHQ